MLTRGGAPQNGRTPLIVATQQGKKVVAQVLLEARANIEARNKVRTKMGGGLGEAAEKWGFVSCLLGVL